MELNPFHHDRRKKNAARSTEGSGHHSNDVPTILGNDWRRYLLILQISNR